MAGIMEQAERFGVTLVGGDTCASKKGVAISITALGEQRPERIVKRSGAQAGDLIYLTGTVGDAAAGLLELQEGVRQGFLVSRQLDPQPRVSAGVALAEAGLAKAMIDVSDGVLADLGHICELSGVGARLDLMELPLSDEYLATCGADLLFCAPKDRGEEVESLFAHLGVRVTKVGQVTPGSALELVTAMAGTYAPKLRGFDHFGS